MSAMAHHDLLMDISYSFLGEMSYEEDCVNRLFVQIGLQRLGNLGRGDEAPEAST